MYMIRRKGLFAARQGPRNQAVILAAIMFGYQLVCQVAPVNGGNAVIELNNGLELRGDHGRITAIDENILAAAVQAGKVDLRLVLFVDDGLRRTFVSRYQIRRLREDPEQLKTIRLEQPVADQGGTVGRVGSVLDVTPFNDLGHRTCSLVTPKGKIRVVQGITEVAPLWTRIQGLQGSQPFVWDMRVATSSIPGDVLSRILKQHLGQEDPSKRLAVVQLYLQAERYPDAERELSETIQAFPNLKDLNQRVVELKQLKAKQWLAEIKNLRDAGQHQRVLSLLRNFPVQGIANETLIEVQEILRDYETLVDNAQRAHRLISDGIDTFEKGPQRERLLSFQDELERDLGFDSVGRLTAFLNLADDDKVAEEQRLMPDEKLSLAVSGWILGSQNSDTNLSVSMSLFEVRKLVTDYLQSTDVTRRQQILDQLQSLEGGNPERIAQVLNHIPPPRRTDQLERQLALAQGGPKDAEDAASREAEIAKTRFGMLELTVPTPTGEAKYLVQLPPGYHPLRRYPTVVTLHAATTTAEMQLDWWAGSYDPKTHRRTGQAARHGYIVIAPQWAVPRQREYEYSLQEHAVVLASLRDAMHRFSIDTDRVFLSGHAIGGDAAWDIGLAHPDLWAGVIPIGAISDYGRKNSPKYIIHYWENAKNLPLYFVGGSLAERKPSRNATDLNRYLTHIGYDTMVVEYLGRGNESFSGEIIRLFEWMNKHQREFFPEQFRAGTMRTWDSFFWWLEVTGIPKRSLVAPLSWPVKNMRASFLESEIRHDGLSVKSAAAETTIWFSPEMLDLNQRIKLRLNNSVMNITVTPSVETILEDARTRGDRQHPFWAKLSRQTGRKSRG